MAPKHGSAGRNGNIDSARSGQLDSDLPTPAGVGGGRAERHDRDLVFVCRNALRSGGLRARPLGTQPKTTTPSRRDAGLGGTSRGLIEPSLGT